MSATQVTSKVWRGTVSNYIRVFMRMILGLVTFRLLYQGLTAEEFGFWALLWSVFGYGILLDFGFGYAAQKRVAELSHQSDWETLGRVLSTIFFFYFVSAAILVLIALIFSGPLIDFFKVSAENREPFRICMILFIAGMGLAFPMGIFPEVLRGQQRIATANNIAMAGMLANFAAVAFAVWLDWPFAALTILALLCVLVPDGVAMFFALRSMPGVRIRPLLFSWQQMIETSRFSLYAYLNMLSNVMRNKTDQLVVSSILTVQAVTPYQAGGKVGEMFNLMTRQLSDALSPAAAHVHATGDKDALRKLLVSGMRWSVIAATPVYLLCVFYLDGLLRMLTGDPHPAQSTYWVGQLLLFWYWSLAITHLVFKRMYMMAGQEKRMMWQGVAEAAANIVLSVALTWWLGSILGVALGSVIPTFLFGWGLLWPWAAKEAGLTRLNLLSRVVFRPICGCLPMLALAIALRFQTWWSSGSTSLLVLVEGAFLLPVALIGIWRFTLTPEERGRVQAKLLKKRRPS